MDGPVLLCGLGAVGWRVLDCLRSAGLPVVAIDLQADPADPRLRGVRCVRGDFRNRSVLLDAGIGEASGVLIVSSDDFVNISAALMVRSLNADVRITVRMFNQNLVNRLGKSVRNVSALSVSALAAPLLALTALTGEVLATFAVGGGLRQIAEIPITESSRLAGRPISEIAGNDRYLVLAHAPAGQKMRLLLDVDLDARLGSGDRIVVAGQPDDLRRLTLPDGDGFEVLWAGKLRRYGRLLWRAFAGLDLAVKICTLTLLGVITFSACIYHFAMDQTWSDSLYHTISVIATGADMGGREYAGWGKVFVSFLRIAGAALIAAFTAIVTNALLTARLGGVFEIRRIPDRGHVVVCGLGNVGFRVVEQLIHMGERVVVVERKTDNPFAATCRRQGAAVVIGDATVAEVLRQARVDSARAVIAATSADLVNLEIALIVGEINPEQRVVVRIGEGTLAETVRQAASVKLALSVAALAAPAFVAGLFGDRVQTMFLIDECLLTVLEIRISDDDALYMEHTLRALAIDFQFVPVAVVDANSKLRPLEMGYRLQRGDRLTIVAPLEQLDRLMRRVPAQADWSVEVLSFPRPMREDLVVRAGALRHLPREETEKLVQTTPFLLADQLTFGQAEELRMVMGRERIETRSVKAGG